MTMKKYSLTLFAIFVLFSSIKLFSHNLFGGNGINLRLENKRLGVYSGNKELTEITSINFNFTPPKSISILSTDDNKILLKVIYASTAKYQQAKGDLIDTIIITRTQDGLRFYSNPQWAENVTIILKDLDEHYFGVLENLYPDNVKSPDLRGKVIDVDVLGNSDQYHENYASVLSAFYMSNRGYASFFDTFAEGRYEFGINGTTELYHHTGKLDWYLFAGSNGDKILESYYSIIGHPKYIPIWACGPIIWRDEFKDKEQILSDVKKMTELKIPLTGLMLDRPYSNGADEWSKMDFNKRFSNPKEWISELNNSYGIQFMTWVGSLTFADKDFPGLLPGFKGYMDLTNPKAVKEFEERLTANQYSVNVRGHKMDRGDEEFPTTEFWYDKTPESEHRNKYVYLYSKVINKFLNDSFGKDEFNYARSAYQRCQPYLSAVWGGDSRSSWDGLASSMANAVRVGFMGFPSWGSDVGGYLGGRISEKLYARWLEFGSWSGMFETKLDNAGGKREDRPPWKYSKELQNIFRNACEQRMKLLPYIYSSLNTSYKNGVMMKPLSYEYPNDPKTYGIWNEYLFGNAFLVAPFYDSLNARDVYLPKGKWYDYNDISKSYEGGRTIQVSLPLNKYPVFVKANSIYVTGNIYQGNNKIWESNYQKDLSIHVIPGRDGEKTLFSYVDLYDGKKGKEIFVEKGRRKISLQVDPVMIKSKLMIKSDIKPLQVKLNEKPVNYVWNKQAQTLVIDLHEREKEDVEILY